MEVLRLCPLVLLVKAGRIQHSVWNRRCGDRRRLLACGAVGRNWAFGLSFVFGGQRYGEMLIAMGGRVLGGCIRSFQCNVYVE
jgi:hypothetical protein